MTAPSVAIVGRPNVGKSSLFNALIGSRVSIEADTPGATRDRVLHPLDLDGREIELVDTGGVGIVDRPGIEERVERQIDRAIQAADLVVLLVDGREGLTPGDAEIGRRLRKADKRVLLVASKVDTESVGAALDSFERLGFGEPVKVSAKHNRNLQDLREALLERLPPAPAEEDGMGLRGLNRIAVVGRRNVGKSTFVNRVAGQELVIASDVPGTTRDAVDIPVERNGERFVLIDTAGMRQSGKVDDGLEFLGHMRTERAIRRADAVVLILDATDEIGRVDKRIAMRILEEHRPCVIALNKWDLLQERRPGITVSDFADYVSDRLTGLHFCPLAGMSAETGENVWETMEKALSLAKDARREVKTAALNAAVANAQKRRATKEKYGRLGRIYYATQVETGPPTFLLFVNNPSQFDDQYKRYLANRLREELGLNELPLRLLFKASDEKQIGRYGRKKK